MDNFSFFVGPCTGGWCILVKDPTGQERPITSPWATEEEAKSFLDIARPDLGFIPGKLPEAP